MQEDNLILSKSNDLAHLVYRATKSFPKDEIYGITSQVRRAALSVPANITEGFARYSDKSNKQFLLIAFGSLQELRYFSNFHLKRAYFLKKISISRRNYLKNVPKCFGNLLKQ